MEIFYVFKTHWLWDEILLFFSVVTIIFWGGGCLPPENQLWDRSFVVPYTGSMAPAVYGGERMQVVPLPFAQVRVGDVVAYQNARNSPGPVMHRVIWRDQEVLICKGDANLRPDPFPVYECEYRGLVKKLD